MLLAAGGQLVDQARLVRPGALMAAAGAPEPLRPAGLEQIPSALLIGADALQEARQIGRQDEQPNSAGSDKRCRS